MIANLSNSYKAQTKALSDVISNLQQETRRQAVTITPVQLAGNEIYEILKKRLIDELPGERVINDIAEEYAQQIKRAEDGGYITATSIEQITEQVRETYPFHPSFKHLVALFKENEGFRQTRGLMQFTARLLKSVEQRKQDDVYLIGTQHLNLNDDQIKDEIERIAPKLTPAITRDISDQGEAIAEKIDDDLDSDAAVQVMTLLLTSSLSRAVGGRIGLSDGEIIEFLAAPNRQPDEFMQSLQKLREQAWYLHREDQRFFVKETENLSRQIEREAREVPQVKIDQALINRLTGVLQPHKKTVYQELKILALEDDIRLTGPRVLVVIKPDGRTPPSRLKEFFAFHQEKNNLLVLSGQDSHMADAVEERLRELYAIEQIGKRLSSGDTLYEEARDRLEEAGERFNKTLSASYNRLFFPGLDDLDAQETLLSITIDNGLKLGQGEHSAEAQIETLLASPRANYKLALNYKDELPMIWSLAEAELWPEGKDNRRTPWRDVIGRAKSSPGWSWIPGAGGMDTLRDEALKQSRWRMGEDGYIEKGPFPKDKTSVNVSLQNADQKTGEATLSLTPRNAGGGPVIYYSTSPNVTENDNKVDDPESFATKEGTLYFWVKDPTGQYESGDTFCWKADLKVRHQIDVMPDSRRVTLQCTPEAELFYTLDGSNPRDGLRYESPFEIDPKPQRLLIYARSGESTKTADFQIPGRDDKKIQIDDTKPAKLGENKRLTLGATEQVFGVLNHFKGQSGTLFKGVKVEIGEGENTVSVRFQGRKINTDVLEGTINSLRRILSEDDAPVSVNIADGIEFESGFDAKEFARITGIKIKPGDLVQED